MRRHSTLLASALACLAACGGDDDDGGGGGSPDAASSQPDAAGSEPDAAPAGPRTLEISTFIGANRRPIALVAAQDGDGDWQALDGAGGVYTFEVTTGRFGVVTGCLEDGGPEVLVSFLYATTDEGTAITRGCAGPTVGAEPLNITVAGFEAGGSIELNAAYRPTATATEGDPEVTLQLAPGLYDVVMVSKSSGDVTTRYGVRPSMYITPNVVVETDFDIAADGGLTPTYDFTTEGEGAASVAQAVHYTSAHGTVVPLGADTYNSMPESVMPAGDLHVAIAQASGDGSVRDASVYFRAADDVSVTFPEPMATGSAEIGSSEPFLRPSVSLEAYDGAARYRARLSQGDRRLEWTATAGWLGSAEDVSWTMPDLTGIDGWNENWAFVQAVQVDVVYEAVTTTGNPLDSVAPYPSSGPNQLRAVDGEIRTTAYSGSAFTP
ncbi:MAG TPA: hypothetical protein VIG06_01895 [Kofleriaceae bacterium]